MVRGEGRWDYASGLLPVSAADQDALLVCHTWFLRMGCCGFVCPRKYQKSHTEITSLWEMRKRRRLIKHIAASVVPRGWGKMRTGWGSACPQHSREQTPGLLSVTHLLPSHPQDLPPP